ncbi:tyrosine-type recombinase/integrase [Parendozoicomonas sp. Alg238-R29]|uniref:tyrosine-type recombinase/integrase n=1 Tax=Parendozoicomonas sp. Alg238-R29 TaxID=2993446 RepID=UPI00248D7E92|nr:tyrosine-type recombinase/integrase [Parendozoicomonas sp. Alg238-R29]
MDKDNAALPSQETEPTVQQNVQLRVQLRVQQKVQSYIKAGTSDKTRQAYRADVKHFQDWGGLLPCSREKVCEYLVDHAESLNVSTLNRRLAGLSSWHKHLGFADPTDSPAVRKVMQGIRKIHNVPVKKARPLLLNELTRLVSYLNSAIENASEEGLVTADQERRWLMAHRDKAMLLVGFWRGFRADTLCDLRLEFLKPIRIQTQGQDISGLSIYLPKSKGDRHARGETFTLPAMNHSDLCPLRAYNAWLQAARLENTSGVAFRKFDRSGQLTDKALSSGTLANWMKRLCEKADLADAHEFSSHSLRRGLATLMKQRGADVQMLMDHIGWKSAATALSYVDSQSESTALLLSIPD